LVEHLPEADYAVCASILGDKDVDGMLRELARVGSRFVATTASNPRALIAHDLAAAAEAHFPHVETVVDPREALARAHELADAVLVTGSLYLLADLEQAEAEGR
jgi:dihydrofolate synthase/folylpolyglutamate synthase